MRNVIEGRFGKKKKEEATTLLTIEKAAAVAPRFVEIKIFVDSILNTDPGAERRVQEHRLVVAKYSDEELLKWVEHSQEAEWRQKPYFFSAVSNELKMRCDVVADSHR